MLLEADPGLTDRRSGDGFTALHLAAFSGQDGAVRLLLARGADPDAHGTGWMTGTPLNSAARAGHAATVVLLLEAGADPDAVQRGGWTPLHSAAHNGDARTVELLLAGGANPAAIDDEGRSVADMAAESGDDATIRAIQGLGDDASGRAQAAASRPAYGSNTYSWATESHGFPRPYRTRPSVSRLLSKAKDI